MAMPRSRARTPHRLVRLFGIDIDFDSSWFIILFLIGYTLIDYFRRGHANWSNFDVWAAALITTALFFASVVLHELAHSLVARSRGIPVRSITLFVFGGVSQITQEPQRAGTEFLIAIVGPIVSIAIGGVLLAISPAEKAPAPAKAVLFWLGSINLILGLFNLIPGFPLDGGRVLRALIWSINRDFVRATHWATRVGKVVALGFILYGLAQFFRADRLNGLWMAFIGWFLLSAAEQSWRQVEIRGALSHETVERLATPFYPWVKPTDSIEDYLSQASDYASLVIDDDRLVGVISLLDVAAIPRERWAGMRVSDVMIPRERMITVPPQTGLLEVLEKMAANNLAQLPVMRGEAIQGVVRRDRIIQFLQEQLRPGENKQ